MEELTDLEICKKIAEIEGKKTIVKQSKINVWDALCLVEKDGHNNLYDPINDDDILTELILNHKPKGWRQLSGRDICLEIIKAH